MPDPDIHPSSIIDPSVQIAPGVKIGPWCRIIGDVAIGHGCVIHERVTLKGPLRIGAGNIFYPQAAIGLEPQDRKFDPKTDGTGVVIGDHNILREGATIHRATRDKPTTIGHRNYLMANSHVGHDARIGNDCTLANGTLLAGHVTVDDRVTFGGNAVVHQFCRVGRLVMFSGVAGATQDIPPFCTVYSTRLIGSLNVVGLRRAGYREHIENLQEAFDIFFRRGLSNRVALDTIERRTGTDPLCQEFAAFIRHTERGITAFGGSAQDAENEQ